MTEVQQNFSLYQGETKIVTIPIYDQDGALKTLTGCACSWHMLEGPENDIGDAILSKTGADIDLVDYGSPPTTDAAMRFTIGHSDSRLLDAGVYYHEARAIDPSTQHVLLTVGWVTVILSPSGRQA